MIITYSCLDLTVLVNLKAKGKEEKLFITQPDCIHEVWRRCYSVNSSYHGTASVVQWPEFLPTDPEVRVRFPALPDFLSSGSGTGSTQPREYN
jgi:hypothetical protein